MRIFAITTCALFLASCATVELTQKAAKVQVHDQMSTLLSQCKNLGPVRATAINQEDQLAAARMQARENVADMGGDTLVVVAVDKWKEPNKAGFLPFYLYKTEVQGAALRCY